MEMIRIRSSAISHIGYDVISGQMKIQFIQGHTYTYCRVPQLVFDGLFSARSKGTYYDQHIRDKYHC